jgi:hypothetical protein
VLTERRLIPDFFLQAGTIRSLQPLKKGSAMIADLNQVSTTLPQSQVESAPGSLRPPAIAASEKKPTVCGDAWRWVYWPQRR